jgi:glutathione peroxidase
MNTIYDIALNRIDGSQTTLSEYRNKVLLVVNTASQCGFTPQYAALEDLYRKYQDRGFVVLGFPCNQFGGQEPGSDEQVATFCEKNYGVSFPMFSKVEVNGPNAHPLFTLLKQQAPGILGSEGIKWNFTKFLVDGHGKVAMRYGSITSPEKIESDLVDALSSSQPQA